MLLVLKRSSDGDVCWVWLVRAIFLCL
jgi:hypothetical protein